MSGKTDSSPAVILKNCILPGNVMEIILLKLPVKSLLKFKAVCRRWYYLISSPNFIKMHLHRQSIIANNLIVSVNDIADVLREEDCKFGLVTVTNDDSFGNGLFLEIPSSLQVENWSFIILDSCNGVVCMYRINESSRGCPGLVIFWNPATREYWYTDTPDEDEDDALTINTIGLCYVEATNDYKLVGWLDIEMTDIEKPYMFFYSLNSDTWNLDSVVYEVDKYPDVYDHPTFLNGCMNWVAKICKCLGDECTCNFANKIMAFNVTTNAMSSFGVPNNCGVRGDDDSVLKTLVIRDCLSIVVFSLNEVVKMELWRLVDYGVEESWIKQYNIQGSTMVTVPLMSWQEEEIVFINRMEKEEILTFYDPFTNKMTRFLRFKSYAVNKVFSYVESLVSVELYEEESASSEQEEG